MTTLQTDYQQKPSKWLPRIAAICAAGVLAGTFAFAVNVNQKNDALQTEVTTSLNIACGKSQAPAPLDKAGIDSTRALGIILLQPSKLQAVCDVVDQALSDTLLYQTPGTNPKSNNQELYALADSLGISAKLASDTVAKTYAGAALQHDARAAGMTARGEGITGSHFAPLNQQVQQAPAAQPAPAAESAPAAQPAPAAEPAPSAGPSF